MVFISKKNLALISARFNKKDVKLLYLKAGLNDQLLFIN